MNLRLISLIIFIAAFLTTQTANADPFLNFSDLTSGPRTGNSDISQSQTPGEDGAYITLWGTGLGDRQEQSKVSAGGADAARILYWGPAVPPFSPADLHVHHRMQTVIFQLSHLAREGPGEITVTVAGQKSNALAFTVREGRILFVKPSAQKPADGSFTKPFATVPQAVAAMKPGDIAYLADGLQQTTEDAEHAAVNLALNGEPGAPCALVAYPGATAKIGSDKLNFGFRNWLSGYGTTHDWTLAKLTIRAHSDATVLNSGFRIVGNFVTAPTGSSPSGAIEGGGNHLFVLGNEITDVGKPGADKLYHPIYISSIRADSGPRHPEESDREIAWNYLHDNNASDGINIYSEGRSTAFMSRHRVHDNFILNQKGRAILLGQYMTGDNWVYNNVVVNAGLGPEPTVGDRAMSHVGVQISPATDGPASGTTIYFYHNTLYACGWKGAVWGPSANGALTIQNLKHFKLVMRNNIIVSTGEPYFAQGSESPAPEPAHNLWFGAGKPPSWDTAALADDPLFSDPTHADLRLKPASPALGQGENLQSLVPRDFDNLPRSTTPALGAFDRLPLRPAAP